MIVDMGAGTTDIAIVASGGIVYGKSIKTAGDMIDRAIIEYLKNRFNLIVSNLEAERIKKEIGTAIQLQKELFMELNYLDQATSLVKSVRVTSKDIQEAIKRPLEDIAKAINEVLAYSYLTKEEKIQIEKTGAIKKDTLSDNKSMDLMSDIAQNGIVLSGGSALIQGMDRYLESIINIPVRVSSEPLFDTIKGIGMVLEEIDLFE
ncbi:Rod shape-determining protein MreB [hydrothermal vent metagenome]|uniref:Rod shape-determining protein MreB n=1 Tax=hydrothermal vent metagenome TaxID=652676 RepID=A0A1W1BB23_9ZZZZ